jgi:hypothetical protein
MLTTTQDVVLVILIVVFSLVFMLVLDRLWPREKRRVHNDVIGWQLSVLGTTYAVMVGFMLYTVWTNFGVADLNVDSEANALANIYRLSDGLPEPQREDIRKTAVAYGHAVIEKDWPAMAAGDNSILESNKIDQQMWQILMTVTTPTAGEAVAKDHALFELSTMTACRRIRRLQSTSRIPTVLWCVLLIGGLVTIISSCMFGAENRPLHALQVLAFSLLLALVLVAIADIDRPFQGSVHVSDTAFRRALQNMQDE